MLALRHPLQWDGGDGGTMANDDAASKRSAEEIADPFEQPYWNLDQYLIWLASRDPAAVLKATDHPNSGTNPPSGWRMHRESNDVDRQKVEMEAVQAIKIGLPLYRLFSLKGGHINGKRVTPDDPEFADLVIEFEGKPNFAALLMRTTKHGRREKFRPRFDPQSIRRLYPAPTPSNYLARLPQFEPRPIPFADLQEYDIQVQREQGIGEAGLPRARKQRIDDVLSKFMAPYIRDATKREPFLKDAKRAIAGYVGARETEYNRRKAKKLLSATSIALETTKQKLQEIARWPELANYLKRLHRDATLAEQPKPSSQKQVKQELRRRARLGRSYSDFAPDQIAWRISQLETVVSLADEKVSFGPGDARRDQIAQDFTDQLASAWHSATETLPTCSKPGRKSPSLFPRLLETINQRLLKERHQSPNNFFEHGAKAIRRLPSAKPRRSRRPRVVGTPRRVAADGN